MGHPPDCAIQSGQKKDHAAVLFRVCKPLLKHRKGIFNDEGAPGRSLSGDHRERTFRLAWPLSPGALMVTNGGHEESLCRLSLLDSAPGSLSGRQLSESLPGKRIC